MRIDWEMWNFLTVDLGAGDEAVSDIEGVVSGNEVMEAYVVSENYTPLK
jgi:hypothetical protein